MAKFISLYSGSKGNAGVVVSPGGTAILVDCGVSLAKLKRGLATAGMTPEDLCGVVLTHEHSDHISGLCTLLSHYDLPVYCNRRTALAIPAISTQAVVAENETFPVGDILVTRFSTYHDAAGPCGYCFEADGKKVGVLTDCGQIDSVILSKIEGCQLLYIESNYDETMLANGPYPPHLQRRIRSSKGHLSNKDCADTVVKLGLLGLQKVILAHVSENNNTYMLAGAVTMDPLRRFGLPVEVAVADETEIPTVMEV